ncbi:MAG: cytochrome P450 [Alphaproteobacteria bacterium]|nr:cytochrome P450 [Alphaproteobacteria bacterium]MBU2083979.1 cytochrome P450 [Alphaproteobacteria bacterium]MBU2142643.1 cytochrome P450 [Alphaproteobacteria bacterium]MBU2196256.1 cytochrome P450 [Alphaproteobacteria bacterium]
MPETIAPVIPDDFKSKDLYSPDVFANPYPYYEHMRDKPIQYGLEDYPPGTIPGVDTPFPAWVVLKHAEVAEVSKKASVFSSRDIMQEESAAPTLMLVNHDDPRHAELRKIAQLAFTPKRVMTDIAPWMETTVGAQLEKYADGQVDFMADLAPNLPALVMTKLIGTPEKDHVLLRRWANAFMVTSDFTIEERQQCNVDLFLYYTAAVEERYADIAAGKPVPDDLMSAFIRTESEGNSLSKDEVVRFCLTLVVAGAETTGYLLGNLIDVLVDRPDLFSLLKEDRAQIRGFIEESLRRDGPVQRLHRVCTEDYELGGAQIKAGDWVAVFFASANRDPAVFEKPDEFILGRPGMGKQMTFGHGIHHCMGSGIARSEATQLLNGILDRCSALKPAGERKRQRGGFLNYGLETCPVDFIR